MTNKIQLILDYHQDLEEYLKKNYPEMVDYRILNQALDARGANRGKTPQTTYTLEMLFGQEFFSAEQEKIIEVGPFKTPPLIIGAGPAGLFCALRLADYGVPSIVLERGDRAFKRMIKIAQFWRYGKFDPENNVCFGEGGAGLFSDGKLITRIKSPYVQYVMNRLVDFGAPKETAYLANPHLGSNKIRGLIHKMVDYLESKGTKLRFQTKVESLIEENKKIIGVKLSNGETLFSDYIVLATGHSAIDMYVHLNDLKVAMKPKDFAVGVRIEHPRQLIDQIQYGKFQAPSLGAARYRLSYENQETKKGTYSFCMCPGGYVLSAGTEGDGIVVNGMSNLSRNSPWSNSALVVSVKAGVDFSANDLLSGLSFQRKIEQSAYQISLENASGKEIPAERLLDFLENKPLSFKKSLPKTSCPSGIVKSSLRQILPAFVTEHLATALLKFDENLKGFISADAILMAPETRTSSPLTILRDKETLEATGHFGLYPGGEGAGHAGGITSAAVDGVKIAMSIIKKEKG